MIENLFKGEYYNEKVLAILLVSVFLFFAVGCAPKISENQVTAGGKDNTITGHYEVPQTESNGDLASSEAESSATSESAQSNAIVESQAVSEPVQSSADSSNSATSSSNVAKLGGHSSPDALPLTPSLPP